MENTKLEIRPFDAATDLKKLSNIWFDASMKAHSFIDETRLAEQRSLIEEEYLPKSETSVACLDGEPVGFISLLGSFIGGIFIAPDRQGLGIGRRLIVHALDQKGELSLEVYLENEQAVVILPVLTGCRSRLQAAIFSFWAGVMPPMPMLGRSLL